MTHADHQGEPGSGLKLAQRLAQRWGVRWQAGRFPANRAKAERDFAWAKRLGSINAAAAELGTTWPLLRKAFATALACQPATHTRSASGRSPPPAAAAAGHPQPGPGVCGPQPRRPPGPGTAGAELHEGVRRDEEYAILGANVVVELNSESRARHPTTRAWAIIRRADRTSRLHEPQERERGGRCSLTP